jgi:DNA-binding transcriptional MerR regulator
MQTVDKKNKLTFLASKKDNPTFNQKVIGEMEATIAGFNIDEVKRMLDTKNDANAEVLSEAARDIEYLLEGEDIEPNQIANVVYKQKMVDYLRDNEENIRPEQTARIFAYIDSLDEIIMRNMNVQMDEQLASEGLPSVSGQEVGMMGQAQVPNAEPLPEVPLTQ